MIEDHIDAIVDVFRSIQVKGFNNMQAPYLVKEAKFPSSLSPSDDFPITLVIPGVLNPQYSAGGPRIGYTTGVAQVHVSPDTSMTRMPELLPWPGKIWRAVAANMQLGGAVEHFGLATEQAIIGPIALQYGDEAPHWGFLVNWTLKEKNNSSVTVSP